MRKLISIFLLVILLPLLQAAPPAATAQEQGPRRVNVPYFAEQISWEQTAIFWFGKNEQGVPSKNYADVRVGYTDEALKVYVTVIDYYLWYRDLPPASEDLTQHDAVALFFDTNLDRSSAPQTDDYSFLVGAHHWPNENGLAYHRQARGSGAGWDTSWIDDWSDVESLSWWCDPGPNSNECGIDFGWKVQFTLPWETLGQSGPPAEGTLWGLGVQLYDRDDELPAGYVEPQHWPESFDSSNPATWGELHFGYAAYQPPQNAPQGATTISAASAEDNTVEDSWMGGGGECAGGHMGGSEINHGDSTGLFVGSESAPTHFPCYNKSYLRFSLDAVPPGKTIISATLTLHHWGNAGEPGEAQASWVHLYTISDPWDEMTIHWNNAPLAQENVAATWIYPIVIPVEYPGNPYHWDATQAVAEAYAADQPLDVAIYDSSTDQHSSKYLISSETGDWNAAGRPALTVHWGQASPLNKSAQAVPAYPGAALGLGSTVTYTLQVTGSEQALTMTDVLTASLSHPLAYEASSGAITYDSVARRLTWTGAPDTDQAVSITYAATVAQSGIHTIQNTAHLTTASGAVFTDSATVVVQTYRIFLPCILKRR
jgi:hypothetical protein